MDKLIKFLSGRKRPKREIQEKFLHHEYVTSPARGREVKIADTNPATEYAVEYEDHLATPSWNSSWKP